MHIQMLNCILHITACRDKFYSCLQVICKMYYNLRVDVVRTIIARKNVG
jgi:hypothetical protein